MHYSQSKSRSSSRKGVHPGTPRPRSLPSDRSSKETISKLVAIQAKETNKKEPTKEWISITEKRPSQNNVPLNEGLPDVLVWVKNEPFDFGVLSPSPTPKIGINILRKIAEYCRDKPGFYPELSLGQWSHICKYKLQWNNLEHCLAYFRVFDIITRSVGPRMTGYVAPDQDSAQNPNSKSVSEGSAKANKEECIKPSGENWDEKFYKAVKQGQDQESKDDLKVNTLQFLLFLYIQHFRRLHKKFTIRPLNLKQDTEGWPKLGKSVEKNGRILTSSGSTVPEIQHAEFITGGLEEIIDFLMILGGRPLQSSQSTKDGKGDHSESYCNLEVEPDQDSITVDVVKALSFLLGAASTTLDREFKTLDDCLFLPDVASHLEYSRIGRTVNKNCFMTWVLKHLKINPWGPSCIPIPQAPVNVMTGICDKNKETTKKNRIFWNTQHHPKAWYLVSNMEKQVLHMDNLEPMSSIKIHRCSDSYIYLPEVHHFVLIQKCQSVTINLGVTVKAVKITDCSAITVSAVGRLFILNDVSSSTFHLLTPSSPIVFGNNREIKLAPYNTTYANLGAHLKEAGISTKLQRWNKPLEICADGSPLDEKKGNVSSISLVSPAQFNSVAFPFSPINASTAEEVNSDPPLSSLVPALYNRRVENAEEKFREIKSEFQEKLLISEEDATLMYQITLQRFKKWLKESGHFDQVVGLCSLQKSLQQKSASPQVCSKGHDLNCVPKSVKNLICAGVAGGFNSLSEKAKNKNYYSSTGARSTKYFGEEEDKNDTVTTKFSVELKDPWD